MLRVSFLIIFILISISAFTQGFVSGKIYGEISEGQYIEVLNTTQKLTFFSDIKGNFTIKAIEKDTLLFTSSFYKEKRITINETHFNEILIIQLREKINELDEVVIVSEPKFKKFNAEEFNRMLKKEIKDDIKENPYKYGVGAYENIITSKVVPFIVGLLHKKEKKEKTITYEEFDSLFKESTFFNKKLLKKELKIPDDYKYLFFDFCEAKKIESKKLDDKNVFLLLDDLIRASNEFLSIIKDNEKK